MHALARLFAIVISAFFLLTGCGSRSEVDAIRAVIEKSDHEQEDALAARDPSIMADTNTARNFAVMARNNELFIQQGIVGIRLMKLEWGDITLTSPTTAVAVNWETWEQTYADGTTDTSREHEIQRLIKIGGAWKIDEIEYPEQGGAAPAPPASAVPRPSR